MAIKVLIIDDSALIRRILTHLIDQQAGIEVVGCAPDPFVARTLIKKLNPDVLTLDVEMPKMNGLDFLEKLMKLRPMPVIMIATLTAQSSAVTMQALSLGAVDFITKPQLAEVQEMSVYGEMLADKIRIAAEAKLKTVASTVAVQKRTLLNNASASEQKVIAIGASTGGTEAIFQLLVAMPQDCPPIVITQHMLPGFTASFAQRLNIHCAIVVKEARQNEPLRSGTAYIAPGGSHLSIFKHNFRYYTQLSKDVAVNRHRPSVDVLFNSVALSVGKQAIGIILTGMGKDGAQGMLAMKRAGAFNFSQDEQSSIVYGMPKEALRIGAVDQVESIHNMTRAVIKHLLASQ